MTQGRLGGSPLDSLPQDGLFDLVDCRGPDLVEEYARTQPRVTYVALGPLPRDPWDALDRLIDEFDGERPRFSPRSIREAEKWQAGRDLAGLLTRSIQEHSPEARDHFIRWLEENGGQTPGPRARLLALLKSTR